MPIPNLCNQILLKVPLEPLLKLPPVSQLGDPQVLEELGVQPPLFRVCLDHMRDRVKVLGQHSVVLRQRPAAVHAGEPDPQVQVLLLGHLGLLNCSLPLRILGLVREDVLLLLPRAGLDVDRQLLGPPLRGAVHGAIAFRQALGHPGSQVRSANNLLPHGLGEGPAVADRLVQAAEAGAPDVAVVRVLQHYVQEPRQAARGHNVSRAASRREDLQSLSPRFEDFGIAGVEVEDRVEAHDHASPAQGGHALPTAVRYAVDDAAAVARNLQVAPVQLQDLHDDRVQAALRDQLLRARGLPPEPLAELLGAQANRLSVHLWIGQGGLDSLHCLLIGLAHQQRFLKRKGLPVCRWGPGARRHGAAKGSR
mmetsp:Transcript_53235/g.155024  ORF Transcript_53235/g.155024 Transcript_53235/m.155024 type:complete len:365 (-) Transcript_53235:17-1111(-)